MDKSSVTNLRMNRQGFLNPMKSSDYDRVFKLLSPVQTVYWCAPGDPPRLWHRADFDDFHYNNQRRAQREIIKGRFQGGGIAYICPKDLELYAGAYKRTIDKLSFEEEKLLEFLQCEGPINIQLIKKMTGMLVKEIIPILHKLQEAFIVYEDQIDSEGDRGWYIFDKEFEGVDINKFSRVEALKEMTLRFAYMNVFIDVEMMKSFYRLPSKDIKEALSQLLKEGKIIPIGIDEAKGYILSGEEAEIERFSGNVAKSVFVLHRNDFLVKVNEHILKKNFTSPEGCDILYYILLDGEFKGIVTGKFKNGPFLIDDVVLTLPENEIKARKEEVIEAIYKVNNRELSPIRKYNGMPL